MPVRLQENGISGAQKEREPAVCHVRLRQSVLPGNCRAKTNHNLTGGSLPFLRKEVAVWHHNRADSPHIRAADG